MSPKTALPLVVALLAVAPTANAQTAVSSLGRDESVQTLVTKALQDGNRALAECNRELFRKTRTPNAMTTTAAGVFSPAPVGMAGCRPGEPDVVDNVRTTSYGDSALVEGMLSVRRDNGDLSAPRRFLALFVNDAGQWKMAAYHATVIDVSQTSRAYALFVEHHPTVTSAVAATSGANGPTPAPADAAGPDAEQHVLDADAELNEAIRSADKHAFRNLVTDDASFVGVDGVVTNLSQNLQDLGDGSPGREVHDVRASVYGKAAVTTAWVRNDDRSLMRYTRVWVTRDGDWRAVATQTSRVSISPVR